MKGELQKVHYTNYHNLGTKYYNNPEFMYYTHPCSYCSKIFYVYHDSKEKAASVLYYGIKKHLTDWDEDHKEYQFDDGPSIDTNEVYYAMTELSNAPDGGYELS